jgi:hypothetical protein
VKRAELLNRFKELHRKTKGEWAELAFIIRATTLGLIACKAYGENQPFDFIVYSQRRGAARIQVKSGWTQTNGGYHVRARRCTRGYRPGELDYFVVLIPPEDAWYIFPAHVVPRGGFAMFYPHRPGSRGRFEKYRNAWHLLTGDPADDTRSLGLSIHASASDETNPLPEAPSSSSAAALSR